MWWPLGSGLVRSLVDARKAEDALAPLRGLADEEDVEGVEVVDELGVDGATLTVADSDVVMAIAVTLPGVVGYDELARCLLLGGDVEQSRTGPDPLMVLEHLLVGRAADLALGADLEHALGSRVRLDRKTCLDRTDDLVQASVGKQTLPLRLVAEDQCPDALEELVIGIGDGQRQDDVALLPRIHPTSPSCHLWHNN